MEKDGLCGCFGHPANSKQAGWSAVKIYKDIAKSQEIEQYGVIGQALFFGV